jgi:hypothetical protein
MCDQENPDRDNTPHPDPDVPVRPRRGSAPSGPNSVPTTGPHDHHVPHPHTCGPY